VLQYNKDSGIIYFLLDKIRGFPLHDTIYINTVQKKYLALVNIPRQKQKEI
jgi:hypothetical protein